MAAKAALNDIQVLTGTTINLGELLKHLRLAGMWHQSLGLFIRRLAVEKIAKDKGLATTDEELQKAVDEHRDSLGLHSAKDTEQWLAENGATLEDLERHVELPLLENKIGDGDVVDKAVAEFLEANPITEIPFWE